MNITNDITTAILGSKGSGKSVLLAMMANEQTTNVILCDMLGVYNPRNSFKTAIVPNSYYCLSVQLYIDNYRKLPLIHKAVIDFSESDNVINDMDLLSSFIMKHKKKTTFLCDEIADVLPNMAKGSIELTKMIKNGRNYGIKPVVIATQRPQSVSKNVFDLCDRFLISKQKAPRTIDYILDIIELSGDNVSKETISNLQPRQFYDTNTNKIILVDTYKYAFKQ